MIWLTLQWQQARSPPGSPYSTPPETPRLEMAESPQRCMPWGPSSSPDLQHDPEIQALLINQDGWLSTESWSLLSSDGHFWQIQGARLFVFQMVCTSGVSAGHTIPHSVLCSCLGFASFPSLPIGELTRRRWDSVEAKVRRFNTYKQRRQWWLVDIMGAWTRQIRDRKRNSFQKPISISTLLIIFEHCLKLWLSF